MSIQDKINKLIPYHESNFIESDIEYWFQLIVNIWQLIDIDKITTKKITNWSEVNNSFQIFIKNKLNTNINCFFEIDNEYSRWPKMHIKFSFKSKVDIWIEWANDNITLEDLLDDALKVVEFCKKL